MITFLLLFSIALASDSDSFELVSMPTAATPLLSVPDVSDSNGTEPLTPREVGEGVAALKRHLSKHKDDLAKVPPIQNVYEKLYERMWEQMQSVENLNGLALHQQLLELKEEGRQETLSGDLLFKDNQHLPAMYCKLAQLAYVNTKPLTGSPRLQLERDLGLVTDIHSVTDMDMHEIQALLEEDGEGGADREKLFTDMIADLKGRFPSKTRDLERIKLQNNTSTSNSLYARLGRKSSNLTVAWDQLRSFCERVQKQLRSELTIVEEIEQRSGIALGDADADVKYFLASQMEKDPTRYSGYVCGPVFWRGKKQEELSGYTLYNKETNHTIVVFKGSVTAGDWAHNFNIFQTGGESGAAGQGLKMHSGMADFANPATQSARRCISEYFRDPDHIREMVDAHQSGHPVRITFTGHSLGGAIALLGAYNTKQFLLKDVQLQLRRANSYLPSYGNPFDGEIVDAADLLAPENVRVEAMVFGAPRVFDDKSARLVDQILGKNNIVRFHFQNDPVVATPAQTLTGMTGLGYQHVGVRYVIPCEDFGDRLSGCKEGVGAVVNSLYGGVVMKGPHNIGKLQYALERSALTHVHDGHERWIPNETREATSGHAELEAVFDVPSSRTELLKDEATGLFCLSKLASSLMQFEEPSPDLEEFRAKYLKLQATTSEIVQNRMDLFHILSQVGMVRLVGEHNETAIDRHLDSAIDIVTQDTNWMQRFLGFSVDYKSLTLFKSAVVDMREHLEFFVDTRKNLLMPKTDYKNVYMRHLISRCHRQREWARLKDVPVLRTLHAKVGEVLKCKPRKYKSPARAAASRLRQQRIREYQSLVHTDSSSGTPSIVRLNPVTRGPPAPSSPTVTCGCSLRQRLQRGAPSSTGVSNPMAVELPGFRSRDGEEEKEDTSEHRDSWAGTPPVSPRNAAL